MKKNYKNIIIAIIVFIVGTTTGYVFSEVKNKPTTENKVSNNKSVNNNKDISDKVVKKVSSDNTKSRMHCSAEIVIYNSHAGEDYASGIKVTDVGSIIKNKLVKEGLKSSFLQCSPAKEYAKSYKITHDLITKNVKDYSNKILLDIHRDVGYKNKSDVNEKKIMLVLCKENPRYEKNKEFADCLLKELAKYKQVESCEYEYRKGPSCFNEDLADKSIHVELGNNLSSDSDVEKCINALVSALKNIEIS